MKANTAPNTPQAFLQQKAPQRNSLQGFHLPSRGGRI